LGAILSLVVGSEDNVVNRDLVFLETVHYTGKEFITIPLRELTEDKGSCWDV